MKTPNRGFVNSTLHIKKHLGSDLMLQYERKFGFEENDILISER